MVLYVFIFPCKNTTFLANVDNVANKKYWEGVFNSNYALVGGARTYKVGVTFDF